MIRCCASPLATDVCAMARADGMSSRSAQPRSWAWMWRRCCGPRVSRERQAKSLILFFLEGGPAHQDLWDMKPDAPAEVRGEFKPIATTVPGLMFCEHLPMLAMQAHHLAGAVGTSRDRRPQRGAYLALTGKSPLVSGRLIMRPAPDNFPPVGAVVAKLRPSGLPLPDFVQAPDWMSNNGSFLPGQDAGFSAPGMTR